MQDSKLKAFYERRDITGETYEPMQGLRFRLSKIGRESCA